MFCAETAANYELLTHNQHKGDFVLYKTIFLNGDMTVFTGNLFTVLGHVENQLGKCLFSTDTTTDLLTIFDILKVEKDSRTGHFTPDTVYFFAEVSGGIGVFLGSGEDLDPEFLYFPVYDEIEKLIYYRRLCGLSQQAACLKFGIPLSTWSKWERKIHKPHPFLLRNIISDLQLIAAHVLPL